jgi:transcriptional antiterminator RfaH
MDIAGVPKWYIVYTKPFKEKKVADFFSKKNIRHYCPMKRVISKYPNHLKETFKPLFASYVFIYADTIPYAVIICFMT